MQHKGCVMGYTWGTLRAPHHCNGHTLGHPAIMRPLWEERPPSSPPWGTEVHVPGWPMVPRSTVRVPEEVLVQSRCFYGLSSPAGAAWQQSKVPRPVPCLPCLQLLGFLGPSPVRSQAPGDSGHICIPSSAKRWPGLVLPRNAEGARGREGAAGRGQTEEQGQRGPHGA